MNKKVAIVITHYNQERYLPELLRSIAGQTYDNWTITLWDCCSRPEAIHLNEIARFRKLVQEVIPRYEERVTVARNWMLDPVGRNRYLSVKTAIEIQDPDYVAIVDADDKWMTDKLDLQVPLFLWDDKVKMVFSDCYYLAGKEIAVQHNDYPVFTMDEDYVQLCRTFHDKYPPPKNQKDVFQTLLTKRNFMPCPTLMFDAKVWMKLITPTDYTSAEDYDWTLKFARHHRVDWCKEPLAYYRLHPDQVTRKTPAICTLDEIKVVLGWLKILKDNKENLILRWNAWFHLCWLWVKYLVKKRKEVK